MNYDLVCAAAENANTPYSPTVKEHCCRIMVATILTSSLSLIVIYCRGFLHNRVCVCVSRARNAHDDGDTAA